MTTKDDPTHARVLTTGDHEAIAAIESKSPAMIKLPLDVAERVARNMQDFAVYHDGVARRCETDHGRKFEEDWARALRSYATGLLDAATPTGRS